MLKAVDGDSVTVACLDEATEAESTGTAATAQDAPAGEERPKALAAAPPLTRSAVLACCVGLAAGLSYGYEPPLVSGLVVMPGFMQRFFPGVKAGDLSSPYCHLSDLWLQLYIAGIYIPSIAASLAAGHAAQRAGRRAAIAAGAALLLAANALQASAASLAQLAAGRTVMGLAQGVLTQAAPVYMAEAAPAAKRATFGALFSLAVSVGQVSGYAVNALVGRDESPTMQLWRISFAALAWVPLLLLALMAALPDTPSSLLMLGRPEAAQRAFRRFRRLDDPGFEAEWQKACEEAEAMRRLRQEGAARQRQRRSKGGGGRGLVGLRLPALLSRRNLPALVVTLHLTVVRMFCGFITVMFLTSAMLSGAGASTNLALVGQTLVGVGNLAGSMVSIPMVKRFGRAKLLPAAGAVMSVLWAAVAAMLAAELPAAPSARLGAAQSGGLVAALVAWQVAYWCSWSPAFWAIVGEINPLETRAAASGVAHASMSLAIFVILSQNLTMLCELRWGMAALFAAVCAYLAAFWRFFTVDTQSVPLHEVRGLWRHHWFWGRVVGEDGGGGGGSSSGGGGGGGDGGGGKEPGL